MLKTYDFYLTDSDGARRHVPMLCEGAFEAMSRARAMLAGDPRLYELEAQLAGEHLFTLVGQAAPNG